MFKKPVYILSLIVLLVFSVSCNKISDNALKEDNQQTIDTENIKDTSINTDTKDLLEIRNSNLWLDKKELDHLSLDNESYLFPEELLQDIDFSHVIINYPLLVYNTDKVYNLEENRLIFTGEDTIFSLDKVWGKTMGIKGLNPYGDEFPLEPKHFDFIDNVSFSPSKEKIAFSIHHYATAMTTTIVGIFNTADGEIEFVEGPNLEEVQNIRWSPNGDYLAYTMSSNGDEYKENTIVINPDNLKREAILTNEELLWEEWE